MAQTIRTIKKFSDKRELSDKKEREFVFEY